MKKFMLITATAAVALGYAAPVLAQVQTDKKSDDPMQLYLEERKKEAEQNDQMYQRTIKRTNQGAAQQPNDPWANMRGSDNSATSGKR